MDNEQEDLRAFFTSAAGRRALKHMINFSGFNSPDYEPGLAFDQVAFHAGMRKMIYYIYSALETDEQKELEADVGIESGIEHDSGE